MVPPPPRGSDHIDRDWWNAALSDRRSGLPELVEEVMRATGKDFAMAQTSLFSSVRSFYRNRVRRGLH